MYQGSAGGTVDIYTTGNCNRDLGVVSCAAAALQLAER